MLLFSVGQSEFPRLEVNTKDSLSRVALDDWLAVDVVIKTHGFAGRVSISIIPAEVISFRDELEPILKNLKGEAEFKTLEGQVQFKVAVDKFGHVVASGILMSDFTGDNQLRFSLAFDQTSLWHTIAEIDDFMATNTNS